MNSRIWTIFRRSAQRMHQTKRKLSDQYTPHNPNSRSRHFSEEKRSKLFYDRPYIYGRLPKFILLWASCSFFWASYYTMQKVEFQKYSADLTKRCLRKTLPFVQAMEDVRFVALQERNYMILKAICDTENPELFELYRARFNQEDFFVSYVRGSTTKNYYDGRYGSSRWWDIHTQRKPEDEKYLVGFQEQSMHG